VKAITLPNRDFLLACQHVSSFDKAIDAVKKMPVEAQEDVARFLMRFADYEEDVYILSAQEGQAVDAALRDVARNGYASEEDTRKTFEILGA
jgi:hypothetical protein